MNTTVGLRLVEFRDELLEGHTLGGRFGKLILLDRVHRPPDDSRVVVQQTASEQSDVRCRVRAPNPPDRSHGLGPHRALFAFVDGADKRACHTHRGIRRAGEERAERMRGAARDGRRVVA